MVAETFPLNSPDNFYNVRASVYLNPITQENNNQIILDSEYMRISFGYIFWLQLHYKCLTTSFPLSIEYMSRLIETDKYYSVRFLTMQTGDKTLETRGEIRLLNGPDPAGTVTLLGSYIGQEWKLHVIDDRVQPYRK